MTVWATTVPRGIALAIGCSGLTLDSRHAPPPIEAIGATVMIASMGTIIGSAVLTGVVTLSGIRHPITEHSDSEKIRSSSIMASIETRAPMLWVFERVMIFGEQIEVATSDEPLWPVPQHLHQTLRAAYRAARERRA